MCLRQYGQVNPRLNTSKTIFSLKKSDSSTLSPSKVANLKFGAGLPILIEVLIIIYFISGHEYKFLGKSGSIDLF